MMASLSEHQRSSGARGSACAYSAWIPACAGMRCGKFEAFLLTTHYSSLVVVAFEAKYTVATTTKLTGAERSGATA